jgi:hypothetical protein
MARPCRARAWIKVFTFFYIAADIAGYGAQIQNSVSKIADLRHNALEMPLQTPVQVDLYDL